MTHGPVMLDLEGTEITAVEREMLQHPATGGVILFSRNYASIEQIGELVRQIQGIKSPALLVAVDQEGGRVQRFKEGFSQLPAASWFGERYDRSVKSGKKAAHEIGWLMAAELGAVGIDFSFAPVLDIGHGVSQVIGDRAFHSTSQGVADLAIAWAAGAREAGMASVGKHFPGHGHVIEDSHLALPVDDRDYASIAAQDLAPFRRAAESGMEGMMPAHVVYSKVDDVPAGFSARWLKDILRKRLGFDGVIFSDDLSMEAANVVGGYSDRASVALEAGCDMVLVCNKQSAAAEVIEDLSDYKDPTSQSRFVPMHGRGLMHFDELRASARWRDAIKLIAQDVPDEPMLAL